MACERCEVVYFGPKCVVFDGPHRFCHTCGRNKSSHAKSPKLAVIEGGKTMRDEIERLAEMLDSAPRRATEMSLDGSVPSDMRHAYQLGVVQSIALNVAESLRRLLRDEHDRAAARDARDPKAARR
jgi:hypothetical protein